MARLVQIHLRVGRGEKFTEQFYTAIIGEAGRKLTPLVIIEFPLRVRKLPNELVDRSTREIEGSLPKAVKTFRRIGREHGITKGAKQFLKEVRG